MMSNEFAVLAVGTVIEFVGKSKLTITGIEIYRFLGEWETRVIVDWENLETSEKRAGQIFRLASLTNALNTREWKLGSN